MVFGGQVGEMSMTSKAANGLVSKDRDEEGQGARSGLGG